MNAAVAAGIKGLEIVRNNPEIHKKLLQNTYLLKEGLKSINIPVDDNNIPIVAFTLSSVNKMQKVHQALMKKGIYIQYVNYVGAGDDGALRIVVTSSHSKKQIEYLVEYLKLFIN